MHVWLKPFMSFLVTEYQSSTDCAHLLLKSFYEHFAALYCESAVCFITWLQLVQGIRNRGLLWAYSCFCFKSFNPNILKFVHGTGNTAHHIPWSLMAQKHLELEAKRFSYSVIKTYFENMLKDSKLVLPKSENAYQCKVMKPVAL